MDVLDGLDLKSLGVAKYPDPVLARRAAPIEEFDPRLADLVGRMAEILHAAKGVGLAAPQVGVSIRLFLANPTGEAAENDAAYLNAEIVDRQGEVMEEEGCLSCPGITSRIKRSAAVTLRAVGLDGQPFELKAEGLLARIFQHEVDHLNGRLILDRLSAVARLSNRRTIKDLEAEYAAGR